MVQAIGRCYVPPTEKCENVRFFVEYDKGYDGNSIYNTYII